MRPLALLLIFLLATLAVVVVASGGGAGEEEGLELETTGSRPAAIRRGTPGVTAPESDEPIRVVPVEDEPEEAIEDPAPKPDREEVATKRPKPEGVAESSPAPEPSALSTSETRIHGRVLGPGGIPLPGRAFVLHLWSDGQTRGTKLQGLLDSDSRFEFVIPQSQVLPLMPCDLILRVLPGPEDRGGLEGLAARLGHSLRSEVNCGDVRVSKDRPWGRGIVLDERGLPVPGARVSLRIRHEATLVDVPGFEANSNDRGEFLLFGRRRSGEAYLVAEAEGYALSEVSRARRRRRRRGARRNQVLLARAGSLRLSLGIPEELRREVRVLVEGVCVPADMGFGQGNARRSWRWEIAADGNGNYLWPRLLPGVCRVLVLSHDEKTEYGSREGIVIRPGQKEDLGVLDLSATLGRITLKVVDGEGRPVQGALVRSAADGRSADTTTEADGEAQLLYRAYPLEVVVEAADHAVYATGGVIGDRTITLLPPVEVALDLEKAAALLPDDEWEIELTVLQPNLSGRNLLPWPTVWWAHPARLTLKKSTPRLALKVPAPGRYELRYRLRHGERSLSLGEDLFIANGGRSETRKIGPVLKLLERSIRELSKPR